MITEDFKHSRPVEEWIRQTLIDYGIENVDDISSQDVYSFFMILRNDDEEFREFVRQASREKYRQIMADPVLHELKKNQDRIRFARNKLKNTPAYRKYLERQHRYYELRKGDDEYRTKRREQAKSRYHAVKSDPESYAELLRKQRESRAQRMLDPSYSKQHKMEQAVRYQRRKIRAQFPEMSDEDVDAKARADCERLQKRKQELRTEQEQREAIRKKRQDEIRDERERRDARRQDRDAMKSSIRQNIKSQFPHISDDEVERLTREEYTRVRQRTYNERAKIKRDSARRDVMQNSQDPMSSEEKRNLVQRIAGSMSQEEKRDLIQWIANSMASGNA